MSEPGRKRFGVAPKSGQRVPNITQASIGFYRLSRGKQNYWTFDHTQLDPLWGDVRTVDTLVQVSFSVQFSGKQVCSLLREEVNPIWGT